MNPNLYQPSVPSPPPFTVPASYNALAPQWMTGYCETDTPQGFEDLRFSYVTPFVALTNSSPGNLLQNQPIPMDSDSWFWWSEFETGLLPGTTYGTGDVAIRFRDGQGRRMMEDYISIDDIIGPLGPCFQICRPGDVIYYDLQNTGTGTPSIQIILKGFKRRRNGP